MALLFAGSRPDGTGALIPCRRDGEVLGGCDYPIGISLGVAEFVARVEL